MTIQNFDFHSSKVRVLVDEHGKEWFVAKDVAEVLGYKNPHDAIRKNCKGVRDLLTPSAGGQQMTKFIPRPDVYRLITKSKLPAAEEFEKWVFEDVLPSIHKTGSYNSFTNITQIMADPKGAMQVLAKMVELQEKTIQLEQTVHTQQIQITADAPKVDYHDRAMSTYTLFNSREVGMLSSFTAQQVNKFLQDKGVIYKLGKHWYPTAKYLNSGIFHFGTKLVNQNTPAEMLAKHLYFTAAGKKYVEEYICTGVEPAWPNLNEIQRVREKKKEYQLMIPLD